MLEKVIILVGAAGSAHEAASLLVSELAQKVRESAYDPDTVNLLAASLDEQCAEIVAALMASPLSEASIPVADGSAPLIDENDTVFDTAEAAGLGAASLDGGSGNDVVDFTEPPPPVKEIPTPVTSKTGKK